MNVWLIMLLAGLCTFAIRLSFIILSGRMEFPDGLRRLLRLVPPAVLSAIVFPETLLRDGQVDLSLGNYRLLAGLLAALIAWRTRNVVLTILVGMATLLILESVFPR